MEYSHHPLLQIGPRISVLPIVHGSGDFAWEVRRVMLHGQFDGLAVPLPPSFQEAIEQAVLDLPTPAVVVQSYRDMRPDWSGEPEAREDDEGYASEPWNSYQEEEDADDESVEERFRAGSDEQDSFDSFEGLRSHDEENLDLEDLSEDDLDDSASWTVDITGSYVPIDPCQGVIAAIRTAMGERIPRFYIDLETNAFEPYPRVAADPYCLKRVPIERFAAAMLPQIQRPDSEQRQQRIRRMAYQLRQLSIDYKNLLLVCDLQDWPWIREAYFQPDANPPQDEATETARAFAVDPGTLYFMFGELPFITGLYERARLTLGDDSALTIDGVKRLLIAARARYQRRLGKSARKITPLLLRQCLQYIRNLTLIERRLTPELFTILRAAQQIAGDTYAYYVLKTARRYRPRPAVGEATEHLAEHPSWLPSEGAAAPPRANSADDADDSLPEIKMGLGRIELPSREIMGAVNRLQGPPITWRHLELRPGRPPDQDRRRWMKRWSTGMQCSWPPEDVRIEQFRATVFQRAKQVIGADAAKSEKFTSSVLDGIDIRETLRHWYDGDIYVKQHPPVRGGMDSVVMLFDTPADPRRYLWRTTWFAEHQEESTLAFFATNFADNPVGPGICSATYGGAMFLYPPRRIPEIWQDNHFQFATTLEERLLAAACRYAQQRYVALLSPLAPIHAWRQIAKRYGRTLVHVPLGQFSDSTVQQLRMVHVLNGMEVRSYASEFIRRP